MSTAYSMEGKFEDFLLSGKLRGWNKFDTNVMSNAIDIANRTTYNIHRENYHPFQFSNIDIDKGLNLG